MKSETENNNHWCVSTIEDFLQYVCPDCNVSKKDKEEFVRHALSEHPESTNYLGQLIIKEELFEEDEIDDTNEDNNVDDDDNYDNINYSNNDDDYDNTTSSYTPEPEVPEPEVKLTTYKNNPNRTLVKRTVDYNNTKSNPNYTEEDENLFKNSISPVVHEGKKKFICNICGNLFTVRQSVKQHIICVHQGRKDYVCPHCKKAVSSIKSLRDHIAAVVRPYFLGLILPILIKKIFFSNFLA